MMNRLSGRSFPVFALFFLALLPAPHAVWGQSPAFTLEELEIPWQPGSTNSLIGSDMAWLDDHLLLTAASGQVLVFDLSTVQPELVQTVNLAPSFSQVSNAQVTLAVDQNRVLVGVAGGMTQPDFLPLARVMLFAWVDQRLELLHEDIRDGASNVSFGYSVGLTNSLALVGEPENGNGVVHVLDANAELASLATLSAVDLGPEAEFGRFLAAGTNVLAVAAPGTGFGLGNGDLRLFDLTDSGFPELATLNLPWNSLGAGMSWVGEQLFVQGVRFDEPGIPVGRIARIGDGMGWAVQRIFEMPEQTNFNRSLAHAFTVNENELLALGVQSGEVFELVRWSGPLGAAPQQPDVLASSTQLGLSGSDDICCLSVMVPAPQSLFLADVRRPVRNLNPGGVIRLSRDADAFTREADIVARYPGFGRRLGEGFVGHNGQLYIGAPGWCEVLETTLDGTILRRFATPDDEATCGGFGSSVAIIADSLYIAAPFLDAAPPFQPRRGAVYRFDLVTGAHLETLIPAEPLGLDQYGAGLIHHEDRLLIIGAGVVEVWSFASGTGLRLQVLEHSAPAQFRKPGSDVIGNRVAVGLAGRSMGHAIALEWSGSEYVVLPSLLDQPGSFGRDVQWASSHRLLVGDGSESLRVFDLQGSAWLEREPLSSAYNAFGHSMGRNPCGVLVGDLDGISRFGNATAIPDNGLRLDLAEFDLQGYVVNQGNGFTFAHAAGQDFVSIPSLFESAPSRGAVFNIATLPELFSDRFEVRPCSF